MTVNHHVPGSSPGPGANMEEHVMQNGKGDRTRRSSVTKQKFDKNWEKTFSKKKPVNPDKDEENEQSSSETKR